MENITEGKEIMDFANLPAKDKIYYQDESAVVYCADNREILPLFPDKAFDLVLTSPPYDNLREYEGLDWDFETTATGLVKVIKEGGAIVWVVGDSTINGSETGSSFRQALYFKDLGLNLGDTMIYRKGGQGATGSNNFYWQDFEYMFVFTKGDIRTFNPILDRKNVGDIKTSLGAQGHRYASGEVKEQRLIKRQEYGKRFNVWEYHESGTRINHPAVFPIKLAFDHISSWSNPNDLVCDIFLGSGTTAVAAKILGRKCVGIEISEKYCEIAKRRLAQSVMTLEIDTKTIADKQRTML